MRAAGLCQSGPGQLVTRAAGTASPTDGVETIYKGRFAPSPTGPLHAGSLVAALASWLDARAHKGRWLVRIEDVDTPRCVPGADHIILQQLSACGLAPDEKPIYQSQRGAAYQQALDQLLTAGRAYPCACTRRDIANSLAGCGQERARHGELVYPGSCRSGLQGRPARAWRLLTDEYQSNTPIALIELGHDAFKIESIFDDAKVRWQDRRLGPQTQNVSRDVGDFVLKRADGLWAYQLAVVVDDAAQEITHVVRGEDLADNTARQLLLQRALGLATPRYMHTPLMRGVNGEKLSKQNGAQALDVSDPLAALTQAGLALGLCAPLGTTTAAGWLEQALRQWKANYLTV